MLIIWIQQMFYMGPHYDIFMKLKKQQQIELTWTLELVGYCGITLDRMPQTEVFTISKRCWGYETVCHRHLSNLKITFAIDGKYHIRVYIHKMKIINK